MKIAMSFIGAVLVIFVAYAIIAVPGLSGWIKAIVGFLAVVFDIAIIINAFSGQGE